MFAKENRLSSAEIKKIFSRDRKNSHSEYFLFKKVKNDLDKFRLAVIVSSKTCKTSVLRHKNKRKTVSIVKTIKPLPHFDFILTIKKDLSDVPSDAIRADLVKVLA